MGYGVKIKLTGVLGQWLCRKAVEEKDATTKLNKVEEMRLAMLLMGEKV